MHTVSILTATYNRADLLPELFRSLLAQEDQDFTWVIIDDGSTDGTEALIPGFQERVTFPIVYHKRQMAVNIQH